MRKALKYKVWVECGEGGSGPEARLGSIGPRRLTEWCSYGRAGAFNERAVPPHPPLKRNPGEGSWNKHLPLSSCQSSSCWAPRRGGAGPGAGDGGHLEEQTGS